MQPVLRPPASPLTPFVPVAVPPPFLRRSEWTDIGPAAAVLATGEAVPFLDAGRASEVILAVSAADMPGIIGTIATDEHVSHSRAVAATLKLYEGVVPGLLEAFKMLHGSDISHLEDRDGKRVSRCCSECSSSCCSGCFSILYRAAALLQSAAPAAPCHGTVRRCTRSALLGAAVSAAAAAAAVVVVLTCLCASYTSCSRRS